MQSVGTWLRVAMEVVLLAMVILSPWAFACVLPRHSFYLDIGVTLLLGLWATKSLLAWRVTWQRCPVALLLAVVFLLGALQALPLPPGLLKRITPATARLYDQLLPQQGEVLPNGEPRQAVVPRVGSTVSVNPGATRRALMWLLALLLLFAVVRNNLATPGVLRRLSIAALVNGALLSLFALLQFFTTREAGTVFWSVKSPGSPFGPFVNRDDFAFYMNICIGLGIGLLVSRTANVKSPQPGRRLSRPSGNAWLEWLQGLPQDPPALWITCALALMISSVPICLSRGGTLALLGGFAGCLAAFATQHRHISRAATILLTAVFALMLLTWFGWEPVVSRMSTLWTGEVFEQEARLPMWARCWPLIKSFPVWGTGYSTFQYVEPMALHTATSVGQSYLYAHNEYLQVLLEGGLVGLTLGLTLLGWVFYMGHRALRVQADQRTWGLVLGALFGVTATSIHSFVEFGLHIPAIAVLFTVVCAQLCGIARPPCKRSQVGRASGIESTRCTDSAPPPTPPHNVADWSESVKANSLAATLRGGGHAPTRERLRPPLAPRSDGQAATEGHGSASETVVRCFGMAPLFAVVLAVALGWLLVSQSRKAVIVDVLQRRAEYLRAAAPAESLPRQIACLNRAVLTEPDNAELHLQLGRAQLEFFDTLKDRHSDVARRWQEPLRQALLIPGLRHLLEARDLCPVWPESHALIAAHVDRLSKADPRSAYIQRAEDLVPADPLLWYSAGIRQLADGQPDKAWRSWNRALQLSDTNLTLILNRCAGHLTPEQILDKVLPDQPEILLAAARHVFADATAVEQRRPFLERALAAWKDHCSPSSADDLYVKAQIHCLLEEPEPALAALRDTLLEDPDRFGWRYEYATMLYTQGHLAEARRQLDRVLGQRPQHASARKLLDTITRKIAAGDE